MPQPETRSIVAETFARGRWTAAPPAGGEPPASLRVATLNVFFESRAQPHRTKALLEAIEAWDADVVALQEVTPPVLERLRASELVRAEYELAEGSMEAGYGVVLMSRDPFASVDEVVLPSVFGRTALTGTWREPGGRTITLSTAHFESTVGLGATRVEQLAQLVERLDPVDTALIVGDFNFDPADPEERSVDPRFVDLWPLLRPGEPGYTEDTERNGLRLLTERGEAKQVRYDRALLRGRARRATAIELVGTEPILTPSGPTWLSDHFGLLVQLCGDR